MNVFDKPVHDWVKCKKCKGTGSVIAFDNLYAPPPTQKEVDSSPTLQRIEKTEVKTHTEKCPECKGFGVVP